MTFVFGFMDYLIVDKWLTDFSKDPSKAPSIITNMINTPLSILIGGNNATPFSEMDSQA